MAEGDGIKFAWDIPLDYFAYIGSQAVEPDVDNVRGISNVRHTRRNDPHKYVLYQVVNAVEIEPGSIAGVFDLSSRQALVVIPSDVAAGCTLVTLTTPGGVAIWLVWLLVEGPLNLPADVAGVSIGDALTFNGTSGFVKRSAVTEPINAVIYDATPGSMKAIVRIFH